MCGVLTCQSPSQIEARWWHPRQCGPSAGMVAGRPLRACYRGWATRWQGPRRARLVQAATQMRSTLGKLSNRLQGRQMAESCRRPGGWGLRAQQRQTSDGGYDYKLQGRQQRKAGRGRQWEQQRGRWRQRTRALPQISCHRVTTWQERGPRDTQGRREALLPPDLLADFRWCTYCFLTASHNHQHP